MATDYTERDAKEIKQVVEGVEKSFERPATAIKAGDTAAPGYFPASYFKKGEDEKRVRLVQDYSRWLGEKSNNGGAGLKTLYVPTEDDINVLLRKDQEKELLNFESFIQNYFDLSNPIHQKLVRELYPNYFERRLDVIRETLSLQERIAKIKLLGMQTKEDVFFVYGVMNGDIRIPDQVVFNLDAADRKAAENFKRGFFNVKKWTQGTRSIKDNNRLGHTWGAGIFAPGTANVNAGGDRKEYNYGSQNIFGLQNTFGNAAMAFRME